MTLDTMAQLWKFAGCAPYSQYSVMNTAHLLIFNGVPEDRTLGVIQTLAASDMAANHSLEWMTECLIQVMGLRDPDGDDDA